MNLYKMKLNEVIIERRPDQPVSFIITRVPGGWIYFHLDKSANIGSSSFVPHNDEFQVFANQARINRKPRIKRQPLSNRPIGE